MRMSLCKRVRKACSRWTLLKVILETGELEQADLIQRAALIAIDAGANFVKSSTGKVAVGATVEAANAMLDAIQARPEKISVSNYPAVFARGKTQKCITISC